MRLNAILFSLAGSVVFPTYSFVIAASLSLLCVCCFVREPLIFLLL